MIRNKRFVGLLSIILVVGVFVSCSDDIILDPLPTLLGDYSGRFRVITDYNKPNQQTREVEISWRFSDQNYWMTDTTQQFCSPSGEYTLGDGVVEMEELEDGCSGAVAIEEFNPAGQFSLRQPTDDSVILIQQVVDTVKEMLLLKLTD